MGLWRIDESSEELVNLLLLNEKEKKYLQTIKNEGRRKHWLSYRVLLYKMLDNQCLIDYHDTGKPFLKINQKQYQISITHSGDYSAIIYHSDKKVGIDIEKISTRIERVSERFLSKEELSFISKEHYLEHLTICWTAKEALFKLYGDDFYEFKEEIILQPFEFRENGNITANLKNNTKYVTVKVFFEKISEYFLSYVIMDNQE